MITILQAFNFTHHHHPLLLAIGYIYIYRERDPIYSIHGWSEMLLCRGVRVQDHAFRTKSPPFGPSEKEVYLDRYSSLDILYTRLYLGLVGKNHGTAMDAQMV